MLDLIGSMGINESKFKEDFARRINKRTSDLSLTQADIVKSLDMPKSTVNGWYTGLTQPKGVGMLKLSRLLKCSVEWLLSGDGSISAPTASMAFDSLPAVWDGFVDGSPAYRVPELNGSTLVCDRFSIKILPLFSLAVTRNIKSVCWFSVRDNSSSPAIKCDDIVLVDTTVSSVVESGRYYIFNYGGSLHIHKTFVNVNGSLSLTDANRPGVPISINTEDVNILGLVFYISGKV